MAYLSRSPTRPLHASLLFVKQPSRIPLTPEWGYNAPRTSQSKTRLPFCPCYGEVIPGDQHFQSFYQLQLLFPCFGFNDGLILLPPYLNKIPQQPHMQICPDTWLSKIRRHCRKCAQCLVQILLEGRYPGNIDQLL